MSVSANVTNQQSAETPVPQPSFPPQQPPQKKSLTPLLIGGIISVLIVIVILLGFGIFVLYQKQQQAGTNSAASNPEVTQQTAQLTPTMSQPTKTQTGISPIQQSGRNITFRAASSGNNGAGGSALTINVPTGTSTGDVMIAHVVVHQSG